VPIDGQPFAVLLALACLAVSLTSAAAGRRQATLALRAIAANSVEHLEILSCTMVRV
jgi:hypothetical protein